MCTNVRVLLTINYTYILSAINPPLFLDITDNTLKETFKTKETSNGSTYLVNVGAEFGVRCSSVPVKNNEFVGEVRWYRKTGTPGVCGTASGDNTDLTLFSFYSGGDEVTVMTPVTVVDVSPYMEGSGSGDLTNDFVTPFLSSRALINDFTGIIETPGQLYAYQVSNTTVVLATRSAASVERDIEFAIGLSSTAKGLYLCQAVNFAGGKNVSVVSFELEESELPFNTSTHLCIFGYPFHPELPQSTPSYVRFSTNGLQNLKTTLGLRTEQFILNMFSTMVRPCNWHT